MLVGSVGKERSLKRNKNSRFKEWAANSIIFGWCFNNEQFLSDIYQILIRY